MNLERNYKLLDVVRDDGIRTFQAKELASSRELQIHLFVKTEDHVLFEQVRALPLSARRPILEFGDELRIPYLITDPLPEETDARTWLTQLLGGMPQSTDTKPKPQPIKASVWKTGTPIPDPLFPPDPVEEKRPSAVPSAGPNKDEPGEFTRMFQVTVPTSSPEEKTAAKPDEPGEFTRMFQIPTPEPPKFAPPSSAERTAAAPFDPEATRLFPVSGPVAPPSEAHPSASPTAGNSGPGEFTRFFQSPLSPLEAKPAESNKASFSDPFQAPAPAPPSPQGPGEFTQMFGSPPGKASAPLGSGAPFSGSATGAFERPVPPSAQGAPPASREAGQYTKMMSAGSVPTLGQVPPQTQDAGTAKRSNLPLILILAAVALFAILIVIFFAMRR